MTALLRLARGLLTLFSVRFRWPPQKRSDDRKPTIGRMQFAARIPQEVAIEYILKAVPPHNIEPNLQPNSPTESKLSATLADGSHEDHAAEPSRLPAGSESACGTLRDELSNEDSPDLNPQAPYSASVLSPSATATATATTTTSESPALTPNVELDRVRYRAWVDGIFDRCFPSNSSGRLVVLDCNEDTLSAVAESIGTTPDEFIVLTRAFARPFDREDAFRFWRPENDSEATYPLYVGILAALAYAASQIDHEGEQRGSFHRTFNAIIGSPAGARWAAGFGGLTRYWSSLAAFLETDCAGERGTLVLGGSDIYRGGRHVAAAMLQSLMSKSDRSSLLRFFDRHCSHAVALSDAAIIAAVEADVDAGTAAHSLLSTIFRRRYHKIKKGMSSDDAALLESLRRMVLDVYAGWRSDGPTARELPRPTVRAASNGNGAHGGVRLSGGLSRGANFVVRSRTGAPIQRTRSAIHQPEANEGHLDFQLTIDPGSAVRPANLLALLRGGTETQTCIVEVSRGNTTILQATSRGGSTLTRELPPLLVFEENANGEWVRVRRLNPGHEGAIVADAKEAPQLMNILRGVTDSLQLRRMRNGLDSLALIRLCLNSNANRDLTDPFLSSLIQSDTTYLRMVGGLRIGRAYFSMIPPSVLFSRYGLDVANVVLDGTIVGRATREHRFQLPTGLAEGNHTIAIDDGELTFEVTARAVASRLDLQDSASIGYEISRPGNLMRVALRPGSQKLAAYPSAKVRLVIGGSVE